MIKKVRCCSVFFLHYVCNALLTERLKDNIKFKKEHGTGYQVTDWVMSVHEGTSYTEMHIGHNILISGKMRYPATPFPGRYRIKQFLLY